MPINWHPEGRSLLTAACLAATSFLQGWLYIDICLYVYLNKSSVNDKFNGNVQNASHPHLRGLSTSIPLRSLQRNPNLSLLAIRLYYHSQDVKTLGSRTRHGPGGCKMPRGSHPHGPPPRHSFINRIAILTTPLVRANSSLKFSHDSELMAAEISQADQRGGSAIPNDLLRALRHIRSWGTQR